VSENRHIHLDAIGGISGDMFVAAMLDALPELRARVMADLAAVLPSACGEPRLVAGTSAGLPAHDPAEPHAHAHAGHAPAPTGGFRDIRDRIGSAPLSAGTAAHAVAILRVLAEAEGRVHQVPIDDVHFREIADWDSVMDVVAAGSIAAALDGATWSVSDLPRGGGLVRAQHGLLPVPAPATVAILKGFRWHDDGVGGERVTSTGGPPGASDRPRGRRWRVADRDGTGAGSRDLPGLPNILRALVFSADASSVEAVVVLSFDVDDMTGEEIGIAADRLREADGVLDLTIGTRLGKKSRPAHDFRLLIKPAALPVVQTLCLAEMSTIGLRWRLERRVCLERSFERRTIEGKTVQIKRARRPDGEATAKVESDDLAGLDGFARRRRLKRLAESDGTES
jgi:hypothetical protein